MAERTAAEVLAMLQDELAKQEAARQLFEPEQPPEREFEYGAMLDYGDRGQLPVDMTMDRILGEGALLQGLVTGGMDLFTGERREVLDPATVTYEDLPDQFNPRTGQFEPRMEETITPGRYGPVEKSFKFSPAYRGITSAAQFVEDMLQDPSKRQEALQMIKQFPEILGKQIDLSVQSALQGERVVDPATGMSGFPSDALLAPIAALGAGRAITTLPEGEVLGVFGGKSSRTGSVQIPEYESQVFGEGLPETLVSKNTGVFIGLDKQPRVFLGSIKADRDFLEGAGATDEEAQTFLGQGLDLKDVLDPSSDFLLREYPDLNNVKVIPDISGDLIEPKDNIKFKGVDVASSLFDAESNVLRVAADPRGAPEDFEKQLAVSIQNYIQKKEGFAETEQVDEIYESLRKEPVFEGSPPKLVDSMEAADAARQAERDLRASYNDLYRAKEKEHRKKYPKGTLNRFGGLFTFSNVGKPEELLNIADFGNASPARKNQNIEIAENVGFDATNTLDEVTDFSYSEIGELKNKINEIFVATPNDIEKQVEAGTYPKFLANKYREAYKMLTDALDEKGQRKELRLLSGLGLRSREGIYGPEIAPRLAEILNTIDIIESIDGDLFKDIYKTSVENRAKGRLAEQAQRAAKGQRIVIPSVSDDPLPVTLAGSQEAMMAAKLTQDPLAETVQADPTAASRLLMQDVEPSAFFILPPSGQAALARGNQRRRDLKTEAVRKGIETYDPRNPFFSQIDKAISKVKREKGTPEQWFADIKKNLVGVSPRDLEILNLEGALKDITRYQRGVSDPGKIDATDVAIVSQTIDRPLKIFDLSVENPNQNQRFESGGYLFKGPTPQKVFLITQPPKKGDLAVYIEQHYGGGPGGTRAVTDSILRGTDEKVLFPNILTHIRTTARQDGDDDILVIEELQPEVFQKKNQQKAIGVPLLKNKEAVQMLALESMLKKAAESAQNTVAVLPSQGVNFIEVALGAKGKNYGPQYDDKIPSDLKKIAKKYGITYDKKIPIPLLDSQGQKLRRESPEFNTVNARPGDDAYEPQMKALREVQRIAVELVDEETMQPALYVYGPGLRFTPEKAREILGTKIGRAQGGAVQKYANGGMVNNMKKPVLSRGLSGLLSNYTSGPLARMSVPRETVPSFARGGGIPLSEQTQEMQLPPSLAARLKENLQKSARSEARRVVDDPNAPYYILEGFDRSPNINRGIFRGRMPEELRDLLRARDELTPEGKRFLDAKTEEGESLESTLAAIEMLREFDKNPDLPVSDLLISKTPERPSSDPELRNFDRFMGEGRDLMKRSERLEDFRAYLDQLEAKKEGVPGYFRGGAPGMRDVGFRGPQQISGTADSPLLQSAISGALANIPPAPAAQTNVAIQSPAERLATRTAVTPVAQALTGARPTDFLGFATTEGVAEGQTPFEPGMLLYEGTDVLQSPTGPTAEEIAAEQAAKEAAAQAAAEEAARIETERLAAEEAARIAAEQEAARIQQEQLAAEQLAAEQAAAEQAAAQQAAAEQLAAEQLAAQQAADAAAQQELLAQQEAQRIAQEQLEAQIAAEQAAAQQTAAEVLAQEQAAAQATQTQTQDARVESASDKIAEANQKQIVADEANQNLAQATNQGADSATIETLTLDATLKQQDADAAALEAELAVAPDPTPIYEAPTQGELLQAAADADTGPLFTTPTDLGTVIPRSTLGLVPQTTGIMSFLGQPNFNVADTITDYTSGYPSSQDMQFRRTFYPFQQVTEEEAQNQYMADIFKPVADMSQFRPALTFGERQQTREKGSGVGFQEDVPVGNVNTGAAASSPGQYGLAANQMYQCPEGYTLAFVNGRATCKSTSRKIARKDVPPEVITLGETG